MQQYLDLLRKVKNSDFFNSRWENIYDYQSGATREVYDEMYEGAWEDDFDKYNERLIEWARPQYNYSLRADLSTSN